ncbi:MAG: cob(I)yrinic acid a,c-diamide adenosyltransferase [Candidatus Hecatellaceae archaeon]|nr:MAG: cob(I)yrinic acid a,c-diamide adenosyltransferase [Candidatus Hecatellales archaeon]
MGMIYLYTGTGAGKTTNALGLALRAIGHGRKVVVIQFMKGRKDVGEYKVRKRLQPLYEIYQFGGKGFITPGKHKPKDVEMARKALKFAEEVVRKRKPFLLVLDEINLAVAWGLIRVEEVLGFLDRLPKRTNVVLTGRYASKELIERADAVNEIVEVKYPKEMITQKGIQY